jgi:hypothetical protein
MTSIAIRALSIMDLSYTKADCSSDMHFDDGIYLPLKVNFNKKLEKIKVVTATNHNFVLK